MVACGGDGGTSPAPGLTGVWRGHTPLGSPSDSILLILVDSANGVTASAAWTLGGVARRGLRGSGQLTGSQLALTLSSGNQSPGPSDVEFDLVLSGGTLAGRMTFPSTGDTVRSRCGGRYPIHGRSSVDGFSPQSAASR